MTPLRPES